MLISLAGKSLYARKVTVFLTVVSIAISVFVLLAIQHIRAEAKSGFNNTISGVDLIVGPRTGQLNLLLYSVFRVGNPTNNISWNSYKLLSEQKEVAWAIPISLGDSHKGYRVIGTTEDYFDHFRYADKQPLRMSEGVAFASTFETVLGAEVAKRLKYRVGDKLFLAHGVGAKSFSEHRENAFAVVGVLEYTGTPVDQAVHVRLDGLEAVHVGWQSGIDLSQKMSKQGTLVENKSDLTPNSITAFLVGLNSKLSTFTFQRKINVFKGEPLLAILPGIALSELWQMMGKIENILMVISWLVLVSSLVGLGTMMLATMRERKHEFSVLRAIGAKPIFILALIQLEALLIVFISIVVAYIALSIGLMVFKDALISTLGLTVSVWVLSGDVLTSIGYILGVALIASILPAVVAYRVGR